MTQRSKSGFTLIELLVVIAIIALLLSIMLPVLSKVKNGARTMICQSRLKQWGLILTMYADDHNAFLLKGWYEGCDLDGIWPFVVWPWREKNPELGYCPMAEKTIDDGARPPFAAWGTKDEVFYGSYGINSWALNPPREVIETEGHPTSNNWRRIDVKGASRIPLLLDSQWVDGWPEDTDEPMDAEDRIWNDCPDATKNNMWRFSVNRHDEHLNTLFLDTSVRKIGLKQLWRLKWHRTFNTGVQRDDWPDWMANFKDY